MSLVDLKNKWASGGQWQQVLAGWTEEREAQLPQIREIVGDFLGGQSSVADFRWKMDSFSKQTGYGGFKGTSGQMFLNMLVKAAPEDALSQALRTALTAPADEAGCREKFGNFLAFVEETREQAQAAGAFPPSAGYTPYFLTFFWEAESRDDWPIYYPASRTVLARFGLFDESGALIDRYLRFREHIHLLCTELETSTWGVEAFLWYLNQESGNGGPPNGGGPEDIYESLRSQGLIFADEVVSSLALSLAAKPFVLLSGISGTGKTQIAVGFAEYLDRQAGVGALETVAPASDDANLFIRLTEPRLRRGHTSLKLDHQAIFALHGLPDRGSSVSYAVTLPDGTSGELRLNNVGFSDPSRRLYRLFFLDPVKEWLQRSAQPGDYLHLVFDTTGGISHVDVVRPEQQASDTLARRHEVIAVRSDWTDPRGLIGYENPLTGTYARTALLNLLLKAQADPGYPYIVILDEMNLARVEYYFSDFLSAMELDEGAIALREPADDASANAEDEDELDVPARLRLPPNVLVIGTVNIDETTHAFSPKVLDRANVIVFNEVDAQRFFEHGGEVIPSTFRLAQTKLEPQAFADRSEAAGSAEARGASSVSFTEALIAAHELLKKHNLHFGYRVLREVTTFVGIALERIEGDEDDVARTALDLQLVQKVLPKLNGGRELELPLSQLLAFCLDGSPRAAVDTVTIVDEARARLTPSAAVLPEAPVESTQDTAAEGEPPGDDSTEAESTTVVSITNTASPAAYPRAARELVRMLNRLRVNGFVSFLE